MRKPPDPITSTFRRMAEAARSLFTDPAPTYDPLSGTTVVPPPTVPGLIDLGDQLGAQGDEAIVVVLHRFLTIGGVISQHAISVVQLAGRSGALVVVTFGQNHPNMFLRFQPRSDEVIRKMLPVVGFRRSHVARALYEEWVLWAV